MHPLLLLSGTLLLISGITHVVQLFVYERKYYTILPAIAGVIYFIIGIFLFYGSTAILWIGAIVPFLGGIGGAYRYFKIQKSNFIIFHILVDVVVVSSCAYLLLSA